MDSPFIRRVNTKVFPQVGAIRGFNELEFFQGRFTVSLASSQPVPLSPTRNRETLILNVVIVQRFVTNLFGFREKKKKRKKRNNVSREPSLLCVRASSCWLQYNELTRIRNRRDLWSRGWKFCVFFFFILNFDKLYVCICCEMYI